MEFRRVLFRSVAMFRLDLYALPDHANEVDFDFGWVFFPMGPRAEDFVNPVWGFEMFVLPVSEKEPAALAALVDMLFETTGKYRDLDAYEDEFVEFFLPYVQSSRCCTKLVSGITSLASKMN